MTEPARPLRISHAADGLSVIGEIDAHTAPDLADAIAGCTQSPIVIDMSDVEFVDSSGLRVLIEAHHAAEAHGRAFHVRRPSEPVRRLFEISGITDYLNVVD